MQSILAIDTCFGNASVALLHQGVLHSEQESTPHRQAERTAPMVEALLQQANITPNDLDMLCCTIGPGSFTGVRIGLGLCSAMHWALDIPLITLTTLETAAFAAFAEDKNMQECSVHLPSKRGMAYTQIFSYVDGAFTAINDPAEIAYEGEMSMLPTASQALALAQHYAENGHMPHSPSPLYIRDTDAKRQG